MQAKLRVQGANTLLNNVYYIARQQNSNVLGERLQRLEESLHNAPPHGNTILEATSKSTLSSLLEPSREKKDEAPLSRN